jgi:hypothetical protein
MYPEAGVVRQVRQVLHMGASRQVLHLGACLPRRAPCPPRPSPPPQGAVGSGGQTRPHHVTCHLSGRVKARATSRILGQSSAKLYQCSRNDHFHHMTLFDKAAIGRIRL